MTHTHSVNAEFAFVINPSTRLIQSKSAAKINLIQRDHNSERFLFELPRFIDGHDMMLCSNPQVHYINISASGEEQNPGLYEISDLAISPDNEEKLVFSWLISNNATQLKGSLNFLIRFYCMDEESVVYDWQTAIYSDVSISEGISNGDSVAQEYPDILAQWHEQLFGLGESAVTKILEAEAAALKKIEEAGGAGGSGGGMTEEDVKKLLEDTAPKDHTHDVASYETDISLLDLESETNGDNVVIKAKSVDLGTNGTAKFYVSGHIQFTTKGEYGIYTPTFKIDGEVIDSKEIGTDEFGYVLYAHEFDGDIVESIELITDIAYTYVVFETLCKIEEKDGFMSAEQAKKLANVPTTEEVNNLIAEAFGTVEAVFDEVHEYAESLGGDEA